METVQDDFDMELLPLFLEEADELYPKISHTFQDLCEQPADTALARKLQRSLHTFKGSARMAGAMRMGEQVHRLEERATSAQRNSAFWLELLSSFTHIGSMIEILRNDAVEHSAEVSGQENAKQGVPFASISKRLQHIVQQTGKQLGKQANLQLHGTDVEVQSIVLEKMTSSFEHLLRNAMAHGLESPQQRAAADKPFIGSIRLSLRKLYKELVFEFMDDGAGLDIDGLRDKAVQMGLLRAGAMLSDGQAMQLIFAPGLSTATEVTEISGRGVGMDVVCSEVASLGGRISVSSGRGEGTCFIIRLPA